MVKNNIWKIYLAQFLSGLHFVGAVLIPFFTDWGNLNFTQILILQSVFLFTAFIFEIPTGSIADRYSRKLSLMLGASCVIIGTLVYVSTPIFVIFIVGEVFWGLGEALFSGAHHALIYDTLKETKQEHKSKKVFAKAHNFFLLGLLVAAPLGTLIYLGFDDLRMPMLLTSVPFLVAIFIIATIKEPKKSLTAKSKKYLSIIKESIKYFSTHQILKILAFDFVLIGSVAYFIIWFQQGMLIELGVDIKHFGWINALVLGAQIAVISFYQQIENILGNKKRLIILTGVITGVMFIILGSASVVPLAIFAITLAAGFGLSREPLFINYMNKYIPSDTRATIISNINMLRTLMLVIINPFVGMLADWSIQKTLLIL